MLKIITYLASAFCTFEATHFCQVLKLVNTSSAFSREAFLTLIQLFEATLYQLQYFNKEMCLNLKLHTDYWFKKGSSIKGLIHKTHSLKASYLTNSKYNLQLMNLQFHPNQALMLNNTLKIIKNKHACNSMYHLIHTY